MSKNLERSLYIKHIYKETSHIIGQNKDVKLSKEILLQLRKAGLRLIPHIQIEA